jgi:hypothetical protein
MGAPSVQLTCIEIVAWLLACVRKAVHACHWKRHGKRVCVCACAACGWSVILVKNEEARLLCDFKESCSLSSNQLMPSVPNLGGSLQAAEC